MCEDTKPTQPEVPLPVHSVSPALYQIVDLINADLGLAGNNRPSKIASGAEAAAGMNDLIIQAVNATHVFDDGWFNVDDVRAINAYLRPGLHYQGGGEDDPDFATAAWRALHGDDEDDGDETGFHQVQNDGATTQFRGQNFVNTVADGIYHLGFPINSNDHLLNEDANENASLQDVARWLNALYTDRSTTGTGLDRIVDLIIADCGLPNNISDKQIFAGASAANELDLLIKEAIDATDAMADNWIDANDLVAMNAYIRANHLQDWTLLHGDDEGRQETGFHKVQNDGANTTFFGKNLVNTVADGIYHLGFEIENGRFLNEDGDPNATLTDAASWLNYFYTDLSTTGTGLDWLVDIIKQDRGLARNTSAADINDGAVAADEMNHLIANAIAATHAFDDHIFTADDVRAINAYLRLTQADIDHWTELHGDDEDGEETGFHKVQNDGANTTFFGKNLVNTIADGIYHLGFAIENGRLLNEDGNQNATLTDVADWLNFFFGGTWLIYGSGNGDCLEGTDEAEELIGRGGNDWIAAGGGADLIVAGTGNDEVNGGLGDDVYLVAGNRESGFEGYDTYHDDGGVDTIKTVGDKVDIGVKSFEPGNGIDIIDASSAVNGARLLGDGSANVLDLSGVASVIGPLTIAGGGGNDTITGTAGSDTIAGGTGNDQVDGGLGDDCFLVSGNRDAGFEGYDTYQDAGGTDTIKTVGNIVDVGLKSFGPTSGIEVIDASASPGGVRLLGDGSANALDFTGVSLVGPITIVGGGGNDTITGTDNGDTIAGGSGNDEVHGAGGDDCFLVSGSRDGGFEGYDSYDGGAGTDVIKALGQKVDIGLSGFGPGNGIETIDASGAAGPVRVLGDGAGNQLDFSGVAFVGTLSIDAGGGNDTVTGNAAVNRIEGGSGNDVLIGGLGVDVLSGGSGKDWFQYNAPAEGGDQILDFVRGQDKIAVDDAGFGGGLVPGAVTAAQFYVGAAAHDADDRFIFNPATHQLFYDDDGQGGNAAILIAGLNVATFGATDLIVI